MNNDISTILTDSAVLLLVGMSVVFVFLTILIGAIHLIEWICNKFPDTELAQGASAVSATATQNNEVSPQVVAAISSAIHQYRNKK